MVSPKGKLEVPVYVHPAVPPWTVSMPVGQGHTSYGRWAERVGVNTLSILATLTDQDTGALAWAASRVEIELTGEWVRVPKFENTVPEFPRDEHEHIIELTTGEHLNSSTSRK